MQRELKITDDGSTTLYIPQWNEQYHSMHGALQEALHVFIDKGLEHRLTQKKTLKNLKLLEIGFGTGLNAFLTLKHLLEFNKEDSRQNDLEIEYQTLEAYPVTAQEISQLNFTDLIPCQKELKNYFDKLHEVDWESKQEIHKNFFIHKRKLLIEDFKDQKYYDLIYYDAFGSRVQPELWTQDIFQKMYDALENQGVLVTYSAKGSVRRALQNVGFTVERLEGPKGKREMLRATKTNTESCQELS